MEYVTGIAVGAAICALGAWAGFDRDRAFYPVVLIVIAALYVLFAVMQASTAVLAFEIVVAGAFLVAAVIGFRTSLWVVVAALVVHGVFDYGHSLAVTNTAVPAWWPGFCLAVDVTIAAWLGALLVRRARPALEPVRERRD